MDQSFSERLDRISASQPAPTRPSEAEIAQAERRDILGGMTRDGTRALLGFAVGLIVSLAVQVGMARAEAAGGQLGVVIFITRDFFGSIWMSILLSPTVAHLMNLRSWTHLGAAIVGSLAASMGMDLITELFPGLVPELLPVGSAPMTGLPFN